MLCSHVAKHEPSDVVNHLTHRVAGMKERVKFCATERMHMDELASFVDREAEESFRPARVRARQDRGGQRGAHSGLQGKRRAIPRPVDS